MSTSRTTVNTTAEIKCYGTLKLDDLRAFVESTRHWPDDTSISVQRTDSRDPRESSSTTIRATLNGALPGATTPHYSGPVPR
ncbi:hypothetical protein SEA_GUYFAGIERI_8 [Rhodococcus phage GuyFagieri]|nr:hypothetical protein SEA_GUYFAGIERI_8 [Rhodococcus phage GuyFagieri]